MQRHGSARHAFQAASVAVGMMFALSSRALWAGESVDAGVDAPQSTGGGQPGEGTEVQTGADSTVAQAAPPQRVNGGDHPAERNPGQSDAYIARKQYLNNFLIRDRNYRILLRTAATALAAGDEETATDALQTVWDAPEDVLVWDDRRQRPESVRRQADQLMRRQ